MGEFSSDRLLSQTLQSIKACDTDYEGRYGLILEAVAMADDLGYKAGFRIDPKEPDWPVAFIELPQGQVSWHLPQHERPWDGHTAEEKYQRVDAFEKFINQRTEALFASNSALAASIRRQIEP